VKVSRPEKQVAVVTGAARGIGRAEAIALAQRGFHVVINDVGGVEGDASVTVAGAIAAIEDAGGSAEANHSDIGEWAGAEALIDQAVAAGDFRVLVCNAGNLRDRTISNMSEDEWDAVIQVHLKGHFGCIRFASAHWRTRTRAGETIDARIITTSSEAGLYGNYGQVNYSSAKAGIVGMTMVSARELASAGVRVNSICPRARTQMTEGIVPDMDPAPGDVDDWDPRSVAALTAFLASEHAADITGQVFVVHGATLTRMEPWRPMTEFVGDRVLTIDDIVAAKAQLAGEAGFRFPEFVELMSRSGSLAPS
jgi:NAD(P)-dependent dehydrogenase (short-subunit alcohol dehydrogenase family)